jgi:hypothetical protein
MTATVSASPMAAAIVSKALDYSRFRSFLRASYSAALPP